MSQPAAERPRPPLVAPSGISLAGRDVVYATVAQRPERYWPILAELSALARGGEVVTAASIFGGGNYRTAAERIEAYYLKLGQVLNSGDVLVVLPADDGTVGSSLWNTMAVAQQRAADILVVAPTGHLRYLDQLTLQVLPEDRPYPEASRSWARVHWRGSRSFPRLSWAAPARDLPARADSSPDREGEEAFRARAKVLAAAAGSPRAAARAEASLARGRAAKAAAAASRAEALSRGGDPAEASAAAASASAVVMRRPLEEFMSPEQLRALRQPALSPDASGAARDPDLEGEGWARGELKALRTAGAKSRPRVRANLLRGRAARAAAEQARQEAEAGGASLEEVADAVRQAAGRVMSRPLEEFMLAPEPDQGSPLTECL